MKTLVTLTLIILLAASGAFAYDYSSIKYEGAVVHRVRQADNTWKYYDRYGAECNAATYETECEAEEDKKKDINEINKLEKAAFITLFKIIKGTVEADNLAQFRNAVMAEYDG